jgi:hypothetical protein
MIAVRKVDARSHKDVLVVLLKGMCRASFFATQTEQGHTQDGQMLRRHTPSAQKNAT